MPRKIEIREFNNDDGDFGCSVDIYCRDNKTLLKRRVFSAVEDKGHYLLRSYDVRADFLETQRDQRQDKVQIEHDLIVVRAQIFQEARACLKEFEESYAFLESEE